MTDLKYSVVVAEDEKLILDNIVDKIEKSDLGFDVVGTAQTGTQAYKLIEDLSPDLLITDIRMPRMDGISLLEKIYTNYPHVKFIIISGYSEFDYAQRAIRVETLEYLLKPIEQFAIDNALLNAKNKLDAEFNSYSKDFDSSISHYTPQQIASTLKEFINNNFNKNINLNHISKKMFYSPRHLTKIFNDEYGITPAKYIISIRISKAKNLLASNLEISIKEISEIVGYSDQCYFSRIFKKKTGLSPLEYREESSSFNK